MRSRKSGRWWYWISICSAHIDYDETCNCCTAGYWRNRMAARFEHIFYRFCPWGWKMWANRTNSPHRKRLEEWFPNLRSKK